MLKLITAASEDVVSLDEMRVHLRNSSSEEDADISLKLAAATAYVRDQLGNRPLITSTWDLLAERWPCFARGASYRDGITYQHFTLPPNTQSIVSLVWTDSAGVPHTVDPSLYKLVGAYDPATEGDNDHLTVRLIPAYGQTWPSGTLDVGEPIAIRLVAGWKDAASVPTPIKQAILMAGEDMYRNRGASSDKPANAVAITIERLISVYTDRKW